jgi:hypothetical protein
MEKRKKKKYIIILIYLLLFLVIVFWIFNLNQKQPTCNDGISNQLEKGVDCGGPCAPCEENISAIDLKIKNIEWVDTARGNFDTVVTVENPNDILGASMIRFRLKYLNNRGELIKETHWMDNFILPNEEKYFLVQEVEVNNFSKVEVEFGDIVWKKFTIKQQNPRLEVILTEFSNSFQQDLSGFYRVRGTLVNDSALDCEYVKIKVVLRDETGQLLSTNSQVLNALHSKEKRDFDIPFPSDYNMDKVKKVEIKPETNIFDSENHIRFYGISEENR